MCYFKQYLQLPVAFMDKPILKANNWSICIFYEQLDQKIKMQKFEHTCSKTLFEIIKQYLTKTSNIKELVRLDANSKFDKSKESLEAFFNSLFLFCLLANVYCIFF